MQRLSIIFIVFVSVVGFPAWAYSVPAVYEPGLDPQPGFNLVSWGAASDDDWENAVQSLYDANVRSLTIVTYRFLNASTGHLSSTSAYGLAAPPPNAYIASAMQKAQTLGMTVSLNPFVEIDNSSCIGCIWRGSFNPYGTTLTNFFNDYTNYIQEMANLAEVNGADRLYVGSELTSLSKRSDTVDEWTGVISAARASFSGRLSYACLLYTSPSPRD